MINLLDTAGSRALDRFSIRGGRMTEVDLMRAAGRAVAIEVVKLLERDTAQAVLILCGKGHNGGDGFAAAGFLTEWGFEVTVAATGSESDMDAVVSRIYAASQVTVREAALPQDFNLDEYALVVDAMLGIGVTEPARASVALWAESLNNSPTPVLAADIPSGINADTGAVYENSVICDATVTMGYPKLGLLIGDGPDAAGEVIPVPIGFDEKYFDDLDTRLSQFTDDDFDALYLAPSRTTYKHRQGKTLVIAGSLGMTGAATLASRATIRTGAGLTVCACPGSIQQLYATVMPEIITLGLEDHGQGMFLPEHVPLIRESLEWCNSVLLGPGLSRSPQVKQFMREIFEFLSVPTLLDADGLMPFNGDLDTLVAAEIPLVVTPHAMEFAQLFDHDLDEVMTNPVEVLKEVRSYFHHTVVLKGAPTLVLCTTGDILVNTTGNPGMATAGSGDVLAGSIATFLSQGYSADDAAIMGVWIHGFAGDLARAEYGTAGMTALEILEMLPHALQEFDLSD